MKTIFEAYSKFSTECNPHFYKIQNYIDQAYEYFGGDNLPDNIVDIVKSGEDYIIENLNSHNYKLLYKKLKQHFEDKIEKYEVVYDKGETDKNSIKLYLNDFSIIDIDEFESLLSFFNYIKRNTFKENGISGIILLEPLYSNKVSITSPILYHFTRRAFLNDIMKHGLKPKKKNYTGNIERLYLYQPLHNLNLKNDPNVVEFIKTVFNKRIPSDLVILKIEYHDMIMNNVDPFMYQDTAMDFDEAVFTQHFIPADFIKEVKIKGLNC